MAKPRLRDLEEDVAKLQEEVRKGHLDARDESLHEALVTIRERYPSLEPQIGGC